MSSGPCLHKAAGFSSVINVLEGFEGSLDERWVFDVFAA